MSTGKATSRGAQLTTTSSSDAMLPLPVRHERGEGFVSAATKFFGLPLSPLLCRGERESFVCDSGGIEMRPGILIRFQATTKPGWIIKAHRLWH